MSRIVKAIRLPGLTRYKSGLELQTAYVKKLLQNRSSNTGPDGYLLMLEHTFLFTNIDKIGYQNKLTIFKFFIPQSTPQD